MPWYKSGTVSCTQNSTTVTGTNTAFAANARVGDAFQGPDGRWHEVVNVASDTVLSISPAYLGATVPAGNYALAPMQGYVKDSADALRTLVNKFGALAASAPINALAALTGAANKLPYFTAADTMALADFPAQARTLLAATTQASQRTALGLGTAAVAPIVGTVSQTGGTPTGAIIETGSNASGAYTKYADGTLVCRYSISVSRLLATQSGSMYYQVAEGAKPFPATFTSVPDISITATGSVEVLFAPLNLLSQTAWPSGYVLSLVARASAATINISYTATGRWF